MIDELVFNGQCGKGSTDKARVKIIQEWLALHDLGVAIDGIYGPATEQAVGMIQSHFNIPVTGIVDKTTYEKLISPMLVALEPLIPPQRATISKMVVSYAKQHLFCHPREIGGQNRGPWVRLYMDGLEGAEWPWCAGFVSYILRQSCNTLNKPLPIQTSFSCDQLVQNAINKKLFRPGPEIGDMRGENLNGAIFFVQAKPGDWVHTGIVIDAKHDYFYSIEGNTNDAGDREGYEVCKRTRDYNNKDFILLA